MRWARCVVSVEVVKFCMVDAGGGVSLATRGAIRRRRRRSGR